MMRRLAEIGPYVPMANRLILDTDGGVDDAQALLLLIAAGRTPDAITTVYGNVSLEAATENVLAILAVAGAHVEVHAGALEAAEETLRAGIAVAISRRVAGRTSQRGSPNSDGRVDDDVPGDGYASAHKVCAVSRAKCSVRRSDFAEHTVCGPGQC